MCILDRVNSLVEASAVTSGCTQPRGFFCGLRWRIGNAREGTPGYAGSNPVRSPTQRVAQWQSHGLWSRRLGFNSPLADQTFLVPASGVIFTGRAKPRGPLSLHSSVCRSRLIASHWVNKQLNSSANIQQYRWVVTEPDEMPVYGHRQSVLELTKPGK